jgi:hypothetical protein
MKNHKFSYDVSAISGFTDQEGGMLLSRSLVGATTPQYANIRLGIKGTQAINLLDSTLNVQDGDCGWSQSGTTTFTQVNLSTCAKRVNESLCPATLYDTYQSKLLAPGQTEESVPFEQAIADLKVRQIQEHIEDKLWNATTGGGDCFDGFEALLTPTTGKTYVNSSSGTTFSSSAAYGSAGNPITEVDKLINALSDDAMAREDLVVFMSYANFRLYVQALTKENFFKDYIKDASITGNMIAQHPNSNVMVVPTKGLNANAQVVIGPKEYFVIGFDLMSDHEQFDIWWSRDNDEIRFRANFNYGAAVPTAFDGMFASNGL